MSTRRPGLSDADIIEAAPRQPLSRRAVVPGFIAAVLPPGAAPWLTVTFDMLIPCPAPLPALFTLDYTEAGRVGVADLSGFSDLGDVPYHSPECPTG
jgi:hypothetical protein